METWPAHVDPLDRTILDLLCSIPATWRDHDSAGLTATEEQAVRLMEHAGLVERRLDLQATMRRLTRGRAHLAEEAKTLEMEVV